jgi:YbgC/YbaW family acyl-CoA thioester hydrolase
MPREYRLHRRVQFYETDAAGIVHFTWFFRYMEEAEHAMWREAGLSIHPPDSDIGWPRVKAAFDYHRPLRFEEEFDVTVRITGIGRRTIDYECLVTRGEEKIATGRLSIACVQKRQGEAMQSIDIPAHVRELLQ